MAGDPSSLNVLSLTRTWPFGLYADNPSHESLLFAPFRRIAATGAPTGKLTYLFLNTGEPLPGAARKGHRLAKWYDRLSPTRRAPIFHTHIRFLGSIAHSPGGMVLYFPGFSGAYIHGIDSRSARPTERRDDFRTHHFSLEPTFNRWHITSLDGERVARLGVEPHGTDELFWFAMSIREVSDLESIYRRNRWLCEIPSTDGHRRFTDIASACDGAVFQIVECPDARVDAGPAFWHFEFTVRRSPVYDFPQPAMHLPRPPVATITSDVHRLAIRSHVVRLPGFAGGIVIVATRVSGTLSFPILLTHL